MVIESKSYFALLWSLQVDNLSKEWAANAALPPHVVQMLNNFPETLHPMSQFSAAITAMNSESHFTRAYSSGVPKSDYWEVNIISKDLKRFSKLPTCRPIHKWLPIKNYFVSIKISPTNVIFELIIQNNFYSQTRLVGLILQKKFQIGSHLSDLYFWEISRLQHKIYFKLCPFT